MPIPALAPFKCVYGTCWLFKISRQDDGLYFCNGCKVANACMLIGNLKGCIHVLGGALIYVIAKIDWIEVIVEVNEEAFLDLHQ